MDQKSKWKIPSWSLGEVYMSREELEQLINDGREIEFKFKGKEYSITYYNDNRKKYISFCEFNKNPTDVAAVDELLNIKIGDFNLELVFLIIPNSSITIY